MRKLARIAACLLATIGSARAQSSCPPPTLKVLCNNQEVPPAGAPIVPHAFIRITPSLDCPGAVRYEFKEAQLTLSRGPRPYLPTKTVHQADINMLDFARTYQPGDRLYIFIPYRSLVVVAADGSKSPYLPPVRPTKSTGVDLSTDQQNGIGFSWLLLKN